VVWYGVTDQTQAGMNALADIYPFPPFTLSPAWQPVGGSLAANCNRHCFLSTRLWRQQHKHSYLILIEPCMTLRMGRKTRWRREDALAASPCGAAGWGADRR